LFKQQQQLASAHILEKQASNSGVCRASGIRN